MRIAEKLEPEKMYFIRKHVIPWNEVTATGISNEIMRRNINRFILTFAELIHFGLTETEVLLVIKMHPEEVIRKLPRKVRHQRYVLEVEDLEDYLAGKMPPLHTLKDENKTCMHLDPCWVLRKKVSNFLHSFTKIFNHKCGHWDRMFVRYTGIWEVENVEEVRKCIEEVSIAHTLMGDRTSPEKYVACTLRDLAQGGSRHIDATRISAILGESISSLVARVLCVWKKLRRKEASPG